MIGVSQFKQYHYVTHEGLLRLQDRLRSLKRERADLTDNIKTLNAEQSFNSLTQDSIFQNVVERMYYVGGEIEKTERIIAHAKLLAKPADTTAVQLGSTVYLHYGSKEMVVTLVGSLEANPLERKISDESPLGQALMGKTPGERFSVSIGAHTTTGQVLRVE